MTQAPRVLIVDDHPLFRDALETALECAYPAGATALHASSLSDALHGLQSDTVDLVLLDLNLGDSAEAMLNGLAVADGGKGASTKI